MLSLKEQFIVALDNAMSNAKSLFHRDAYNDLRLELIKTGTLFGVSLDVCKGCPGIGLMASHGFSQKEVDQVDMCCEITSSAEATCQVCYKTVGAGVMMYYENGEIRCKDCQSKREGEQNVGAKE